MAKRARAGKAPAKLLLDVSASLFWRGFFSNVVQSEIDPFFLGVPGFVQHDTSGAGLPAQAARLGALYIVIATSIHASIVLLASRLRPLLFAGAHQISIRQMLSFALVLVAVWLAGSRPDMTGSLSD